MTRIPKLAEVQDSLSEVIASNNGILVLGAGASVGCGAPTAKGLVQQLSKRFPNAGITDGASLFDAGTEVAETPAYGRQDLLEHIAGLLRNLEPSSAYQAIPRARWRGIFTTNYDDLIEKAYAKVSSRVQNVQPVDIAFRGKMLPRDNHVQLYYLMGSIKNPSDPDSAPVATQADYHRTVGARAEVLDLFKNAVIANGKVIYVGYSFGDFVFERALDSVIESLGARDTPYGYALLLDWPADRNKPYNRLISKHVTPVEASFEELADLIARTSAAPPKGSASPAKAIVTSTVGTLTLDATAAGVFSESFELLTDAALARPHLAADDKQRLRMSFLRGDTTRWAAYASGWAFKRPTYARVRDSAIGTIGRGQRVNSCILVHGAAGLGKTVLSRQLAFDIYRDAKTPVAIARPRWRNRPDFKIVDRLYEDLESDLPEGQALQALVLIIDDAELLDKTVPQRLLRYLKAKERNVLLVLVARTNEFYRSAADSSELTLPEMETFQLSETLEADEIKALVAHLAEIGEWSERRITNADFWVKQAAANWDSRFFDTLYSLVEATQEPMRDRVWSEFSNLSELSKSAYLTIAGLHQFGMGLKMEVLMRVLNVPFASFEREIVRSDAREVLFTDQEDGSLNIYFKGRSRLISQLVFERALPEKKDQLEIFKKFVACVRPSETFGLDELDALRTLLVHVFGPSGFDKRFSALEVSELFAAAAEHVADDVLEHHFGLVEKNAGKLLSAREHLQRALELNQSLPFDAQIVRESPQHIENSLALVIGQLAQEALKRGDRAAAEELFESAVGHFKSARSGSFPNAAAYDAHAKMLLVRAKRLFERGTADHAMALIDALDVAADGIDNVNEEYRPELVELQAEIMSELGQRDEVTISIRARMQSAAPAARARYGVLLARIGIGNTGEPSKKSMRAAYRLAIAACDDDPTYFSAWKLRAEMHGKLHPADTDEYRALLEKALSVGDGLNSLWVLYELAVTAFNAEDYAFSAATFARLRRQSAGHHHSLGAVELAGERGGGEAFEFTGRVGSTDRKSSGLIRASELAAFGEIRFNPRFQRFYSAREGDEVTFLIEFNYRGISATELKRI